MNQLAKSPKTFAYSVFVMSSFVFGSRDGYKKWVELTRDKNFINLIRLLIRAGIENAMYAAALPVLIPFCVFIILHKKGYIGTKM